MAASLLNLYSIAAPGLERITGLELRAMGMAPQSEVRGGVSWQGTMQDVYRANLWLRTASRVVIRAASFHAASFAELERRAARVPWGRFVRARDTVRFRVTCHGSALYHSGAVAQRLAASVASATGCGVADQQDSRAGDAHEDDSKSTGGAASEQLFIVRIDHDAVTVSADSSGTLLHKRGYRQASAKAPMRETLAAAMLLSSGWHAGQPLLDPMCGAGTIPIEGALIARKVAPGLRREFRFERWPGFDSRAWAELRDSARSGEVKEEGPVRLIVAADRDAGAIAATLSNAERAGVAADLEVVQRPLSASTAPEHSAGPGWIVTNPPYGVRVGSDVRDLYAAVGALLRGRFTGWNVGIAIASPELAAQLGIHLEQMFESSNGGIRIRFMTGKGANR